jgi:hypothetical protein
MPSVYEPIVAALGVSAHEVEEAWARAPVGDWRDSLRIVGSLVICSLVPPRFLRLVESPKALVDQLNGQRLEDINELV